MSLARLVGDVSCLRISGGSGEGGHVPAVRDAPGMAQAAEMSPPSGRRILLMHITPASGHHRASCAIACALHQLDPSAAVTSLDASEYTSRPVRWAVAQTYRSLIQHQPDIWEYLYDNPAVHSRIQRLRTLLHRYHSGKLRRVLDHVQPHAIACTQAYPCGMVADFKKSAGLLVPLVGVLTDYAPHLYWFHDTVDVYCVPSEKVRQRFLMHGVPEQKVRVQGIPIDPGFAAPTERETTARALGLDLTRPILLIAGGGSGFGPLREIVAGLDLLPHPCQLVVVTGTNRTALRHLQHTTYRHRVVPLGYVDNMAALMDVATLLISKPGGLTTSEALAKRLPLIMVNPIPGQEAYNAQFLLSQGAAVQAASAETTRQTVRDLLDNPERLEMMRRRAGELSRPSAAVDIARMLLGLSNGDAP